MAESVARYLELTGLLLKNHRSAVESRTKKDALKLVAQRLTGASAIAYNVDGRHLIRAAAMSLEKIDDDYATLAGLLHQMANCLERGDDRVARMHAARAHRIARDLPVREWVTL